MESISALIVDDEQLARLGLEKRLAAFPQINVLSQCSNGNEALRQVKLHQPDVIFLDIQMPGLDGLELTKTLQSENLGIPQIVYVTGHKDFACEAFDFEPLDYLLKPFDHQRMEKCIVRLEERINQIKAFQRQNQLVDLLARKTGSTVDGLINNLEKNHNCKLADVSSVISLKSGTEWVRITLQDIIWIEAVGDYMCVHTVDGQQIIRKTLKELEQELDGEYFPRVNRSAIINVNQVERYTPNSNGEYVAHLHSGEQIKVSRKYKFRLSELCK